VLLNPKEFKDPISKSLFTRLYFNFSKHLNENSVSATGSKHLKKEVIWSMAGVQTTEQEDCSKFRGIIPHYYKKDLTVVDLLPGTPYNQPSANCCKGWVIRLMWRTRCTCDTQYARDAHVAHIYNNLIQYTWDIYLRVDFSQPISQMTLLALGYEVLQRSARANWSIRKCSVWASIPQALKSIN